MTEILPRWLQFQSLKGFQRLWSFLHMGDPCQLPDVEFQSLKGFQRLWSFTPALTSAAIIKEFQSLKGFQRLWSHWFRTCWSFWMLQFQSLKGFQRLWSKKLWCKPIKSLKVSIPKRVSEALKQILSERREDPSFVSIPKRVSEALKPKLLEGNTDDCLFQSLKGFQRLWSWIAA